MLAHGTPTIVTSDLHNQVFDLFCLLPGMSYLKGKSRGCRCFDAVGWAETAVGLPKLCGVMDYGQGCSPTTHWVQ